MASEQTTRERVAVMQAVTLPPSYLAIANEIEEIAVDDLAMVAWALAVMMYWNDNAA